MNSETSVKAKNVIPLATSMKVALGLRKPTAKLALLVVLLAAAGLATVGVHGQPAIPTTFSLPSAAADTSKPGFVWRIHQVVTGQPNDNARTEAQLAGLLGDNIADPNAQGVAIAPSSPPNPSTAPIAFNIDSVVELSAGAFYIYNGNLATDVHLPRLSRNAGS